MVIVRVVVRREWWYGSGVDSIGGGYGGSGSGSDGDGDEIVAIIVVVMIGACLGYGW